MPLNFDGDLEYERYEQIFMTFLPEARLSPMYKPYFLFHGLLSTASRRTTDASSSGLEKQAILM